MSGIDIVTPIWVSDESCLSLEVEKVQTDMVDSLSPPHPAEYISAQNALAQDCATLQLIDQDLEACRLRIAQAQMQIRLLERQRNAVEHRVSVHRARLSPLRTIPDQILQEIFEHCLPNTAYVVPSAHSAPLVLTHVCRRWRAVAHGTSELWSSVTLYDRGMWNYELELDMLRCWLARARARPLSLRITALPRTYFGREDDPAHSDMFQLALAHATQLHDLSMHVGSAYLERFLSAAGSLPALTSIALALHQHQHHSGAGDDPAAPATPRLRHMALGGTQRPVPRALLAHVTHLALDGHTPDLQVLRDCPRLMHLAVTAQHAARFPLLQTSGPEHSSAVVTMDTVRTLEVRLDEEALRLGAKKWLKGLLDAVELPALETLVVAVPRGEDPEVWERGASNTGLIVRSRYPQLRLERRVLDTAGRQGGGGEGFENWAIF